MILQYFILNRIILQIYVDGSTNILIFYNGFLAFLLDIKSNYKLKGGTF